MTTNIHNQSTLSKFGDLLFARQAPQISAERHQSLADSFRAWRTRRAAEAELSRMSDRELADIGVSREGIKAAVRVHRAIR